MAVIQPVDININQDELRKRIIEKCEQNVADFSMPREIIFREALPKTAMGKVNFKLLTEELSK